jgi:hypothetical protein
VSHHLSCCLAVFTSLKLLRACMLLVHACFKAVLHAIQVSFTLCLPLYGCTDWALGSLLE